MAAALPLPRAALMARLAVTSGATLAAGIISSLAVAVVALAAAVALRTAVSLVARSLAVGITAAGILRSHTVAAGILRSLNLLRSLTRAMAVRPRALRSLGALSEREGCAQQCHCN